MNIFNRDKIDWENFTAKLLQHNVVYHSDEYSGYDIIISEILSWCKNNPEQTYQRGYKPGDIVSDTRILSYYIGPTRQLTWKELTLALGFCKDIILPDHHDCNICFQREKCNASFKNNKDQERCSGWMKEHGEPDDEEEYKKFIDDLLYLKYDNNISINFDNISEEEFKKLITELK